MAQLWGGRFTKETDKLVYNFNASLSFDSKLYKQDITGSMAHASMLAKQGIIEEQEKAGKALVIRPSEPITISRTENDPEKLEEVYQLGRKDGQKNLEKMKIFLKTSRAGIPE